MTWATLAFPSTGIGTTSITPVVITLWNTGASAVAVSSVTDSNTDEFPWTSTCNVAGSLQPNSSCAVTAQFRPSATGAQTATLTIDANSKTQTFSLTGTGVAPVNPRVSISPVSGSTSTVFTLTASGLTPSGQVTFQTAYMPARGNPDIPFAPTTWTADAGGNLTIASTSDAPGSYENWLVDVASGISSNHATHQVQ
jgi:HYDIN/CFA65/VesB family protein